MPIRFRPDGTFEFDTPEEAMEWYKLLSASEKKIGADKRQPETPGSEYDEPVTSKEPNGASRTGFNIPVTPPKNPAPNFIALLNGNGRKVVKALVEAHPRQLTTEQLAEASGLEGRQLGPVFRHIYGAADRCHLPRERAIARQEAIRTDGTYQSVYGASEEVVEAAKKRPL